MVTKLVKVEMFNEHAYCECGGEFNQPPVDPYDPVVDIAVFHIGPKRYVHVCDKCGKTEWLDHPYPRKIYKEVE